MTSIATPPDQVRGQSSAGSRALFDSSSRLLRNRSLMLGRSKFKERQSYGNVGAWDGDARSGRAPEQDAEVANAHVE